MTDSVIDLTQDNSLKRKRSEWEEEQETMRTNQKVTPKREWKGIMRQDGRLRLVQEGSYHYGSVSKGKLAECFPRPKLISIAWKIGVSNPDGFDQDDCEYFGVTPREVYDQYVAGWRGYKKNRILRFILNRLIHTGRLEYA